MPIETISPLHSMTNAESAYFAVAETIFGRRAVARLRWQLPLRYSSVRLKGSNVLDVGGGVGTHALYALARGANQCHILEPEAAGGHQSMIQTISRWSDLPYYSNVSIEATTLQEFEHRSVGFDVVLVNDAINHLDEEACITLRQNKASWDTYKLIFQKLYSLTVPGGMMLLTDCSSRNLFAALGVRNPIDPAIEWHKHQPPQVWCELAEAAGYRLVSQRWTTPTVLSNIGRSLLSNALAAWLYTSHFVLTFEKP